MKKEDLKAGMGVELRNGFLCVLVPNKDKLCLMYHNEKRMGWASSIPDYNNSLANNDFLEHDIMKVFDLSDYSPFYFENRTLLWEREPKIKLTDEEIEILKALKVLDMKFIARNRGGQLNAFNARYTGCEDGVWLIPHNNSIRVKSNVFNFIDDEKVQSINELLKGE